ncbi:MAG TPA: S41 family peptidase, partial [Burkholderiaceae bacterium]
MLKKLRYLLATLLALLVLLAAIDVFTYDRDAWRRDYTQLKRGMAQGYANLDWIASQRQLDLPALDRATIAKLDNSVSHVQGFFAIRGFVRTFNDPHLRLAWGKRPAQSVTLSTWHLDKEEDSPEPAEPPVASCKDAGYEDGKHAFVLPVADLPGWREQSAGPFAAGVVGTTGILRIAQLGEDRYLTQCESVFTPGLTSSQLKLKVRAALQRELEARLRELKAAGVVRLVVDVTGNGGGTEWVDEVIALFTDRTLTRSAVRAVAPACDRSGIWRGEKVCPALIPSGVDQVLQGRGVWTGPLLVLADRRTGSAAEDFVVWLKENNVATVLGERTAGAGCGYVNGGHVSVLQASRFDVKMPNCARYLR